MDEEVVLVALSDIPQQLLFHGMMCKSMHSQSFQLHAKPIPILLC